jgi:biopolymer transport protein ExbD
MCLFHQQKKNANWLNVAGLVDVIVILLTWVMSLFHIEKWYWNIPCQQ